jgi:hypothetical protein
VLLIAIVSAPVNSQNLDHLLHLKPGAMEIHESILLQAVYAAKYVLSEKAEKKKLSRLWASFPRSWKSRAQSALRSAQDLVPLEHGVILRLRKILI